MSAVKDYLPGMIVSFHTHSYQLLLHVQDLVKPEKKDQTRKKKKKKLSVGRGGIAEVLAPAVGLLRVNCP